MPRQKDYTGMRFGSTVALYPTEKRRKNNVIWVMRCDCGKEIERCTGDMHRCDSCGCTRGHGKRKDYTGRRTENSVAIRDTGKTVNQKAVWIMRCDFCGGEFESTTDAIRCGHAAHKCEAWREWMNKKLQKEKTYKPGPRLANSQAHVNACLSAYKGGAAKRGFSFEIDIDYFRELIEQPCHYCGALPKSRKINRGLAGMYAWNGIDRVDSALGYTVDNCVPCCSQCNRAKGTLNSDAFLAWVRNVYVHSLTGPERPLSGK